MITIALVPIITVLCLVVLMAFVSNRRAAAIAEIREEVDEHCKTILKKDRALKREVIKELIAGKSLTECLKAFLNQRAEFVEGNPRWGEDELELYRKKKLKENGESQNRKLMMPAIGGSIALICGCVVLVAVLYQFESSKGSTNTNQEETELLGDSDVFDDEPISLNPTEES